MKKLLSLLTMCAMLLNSIPVMKTNAEELIYGDANEDGKVNIADATAIIQHIGNKDKYALSEHGLLNADCYNTGDGVTGMDAYTIQMFEAELIKNLPFNQNYSGLVINEVCTSNKNSLKDSNGNSPDWIELYNKADYDIDISGVGISDSKKNRYKFMFPNNTIIKSDGYIIVLCDNTDIITETEYHSPFKLSASGETIYLTSPIGNDIDIVTVPQLDTDITYGRFENGEDNFYLLEPTPNESNNNGSRIINVTAPEPSVNGGFYNDEFELSFSSGNEIFYTLDGSDPRTSETAEVYKSPIRIYNNTSEPNILSNYNSKMTWLEDFQSSPDFSVDKCITVRAVSRDIMGNFSNVISESYFIGKRADYFSELKVMSITTDKENLFDDESGIFVNYSNKGRDWERPCNIQIFDNGENVFSQDVGVRVAGNWSRNYPQKGMTFYARNDYGASKMKYDFFDGNAVDCNGKIITEFKKVTLRNGGDGFDNVRFRDDLNASLASGLNISTQAKNDYIVFINGEFWGYYSMQEKFDDNYIESHYKISADNVTINKCGEFEGNEQCIEEYKEFFEWACIADMTLQENYDKFCEKMDVQSFIDFITVQTYICNWDSLVNVNNYMLWRANETNADNIYADGKWRFMLYDTEYSTGFLGTNYDVPNILNLDNSGKDGSFGTVLYNLFNNAEFREEFRESYYRIATENFSYSKASERIDDYLNRLSDAYTDTEKRFVYNSNFKENSEIVREFFNNRYEYAIRYLEQLIEKL